MPAIDRRQAILDLLKDLKGLDPLKQLFWSQLNYERVNTPLPRHDWTAAAAGALSENPVLFAAGGADRNFHVIYARLKSPQLPLGDERTVVTQLLKSHPYALFLFSNEEQTRWHFLNVNYDRETARRRLFRRMTISPQEGLRTAAEQLLHIDLADSGDAAALTIQEKHDRAFDVEAVTDQFFKDFRNLFEDLKAALPRTVKEPLARHAFTQRLLNRQQGAIKCAPDTPAQPLPPAYNAAVMRVKRQFAEEARSRQAEMKHTLALRQGQRYVLRELRVLFGAAEDEDVKAQINILEKAFRAATTEAVNRELNRLRRDATTGNVLLKRLTDIYYQHNMKDWLERKSLQLQEDPIPIIVCSEKLG